MECRCRIHHHWIESLVFTSFFRNKAFSHTSHSSDLMSLTTKSHYKYFVVFTVYVYSTKHACVESAENRNRSRGRLVPAMKWDKAQHALVEISNIIYYRQLYRVHNSVQNLLHFKIEQKKAIKILCLSSTWLDRWLVLVRMGRFYLYWIDVSLICFELSYTSHSHRVDYELKLVTMYDCCIRGIFMICYFGSTLIYLIVIEGFRLSYIQLGCSNIVSFSKPPDQIKIYWDLFLSPRPNDRKTANRMYRMPYGIKWLRFIWHFI